MQSSTIQFVFYMLAAMLCLALSFLSVYFKFHWGFFAGYMFWGVLLVCFAIASESDEKKKTDGTLTP